MLARRDIDPRVLLAALAPTRADARIIELGEGFDNVAWGIDDDLVLRISKKADRAARRADALRDIRIARFASVHSTLATGEVVEFDANEGALLSTLVAGRGADVRAFHDLVKAQQTLAEFLTALWRVPAEVTRDVVGPPDLTATHWLERTAAQFGSVARHFLEDDRHLIEQFLASPIAADDERAVFCHNDLGDEHLIVDDAGDLIGVIDWSDAVVGDPARDIALLMFDLGPDFAAAVVDRCGSLDNADLLIRARWWAARAGIEGVSLRVAQGRPVAQTLERLRTVLGA